MSAASRTEAEIRVSRVGPHDNPLISQCPICASAKACRKGRKPLGAGAETPGHTLDHISYVSDSEKALFRRDTLFSIGVAGVRGTYDDVDRCQAARLPTFQTLFAMIYAANVKFRSPSSPTTPREIGAAEYAAGPANKRLYRRCLAKKKANVFLRDDDRPRASCG